MQTTVCEDRTAESGCPTVETDASDGYELWQDIGGSD